MSLLLAAAVLPLVPIAADDSRLDAQRTYVSPNAETAFASGEGEVYCLDRPRRERFRSICLTQAEWAKAVKLAEAAPKRGPRPLLPSQDNGTATGSSAQIYGRSR